LDELERRLPAGEPLRGMQVFRSTKAACAACHQVAYVGGTSGPDLSRIGSTRTERELLEAIVYPSNRIEQSYQPIKVQLTDGRVFNGLVERQDSTTLELITGPDQRIRLAVTEIEERQPSSVSVMPTGIHETLSDQQLADLLAFLKSRR
jgi:putative heme-binding domain-containing protein